MYRYHIFKFALCLIVAISFLPQAFAQEAMRSSDFVGKQFTAKVRVVDETTLAADKVRVSLWGVDRVDLGSAVFDLRARTALDAKLLGQPITCSIKSYVDSHYRAQCVNANEEDLSLYMLQEGFVTLNRSEVFGSIFEGPYVEAEKLSQSLTAGVWAVSDKIGDDGHNRAGREFIWSAVFLGFIFVISMGVLSFYIMRGFGKVVALQNHTMDLAVKERELKEREKNVIASMIHTEIRENKPKIDAYLTVYEEMLMEANSSDSPTFMKTGEIVQRQPALNRSVYDGNTGRLDVLGARMASEIIHYYARIKTNPDYIEIKPDMPVEKVREVIKRSVTQAKKLEMISTRLLESFCHTQMVEDI